MPELPEVETVRLGLEPVLTGRHLKNVTVKRADLRIAFPADFAKRLTGRKVEALERRAKYLLARLDKGETLIVHLGMSGRFTTHDPRGKKHPGVFARKVVGDGTGEGAHDHVIFVTDENVRVVYTDHRRFGLMTLVETESLPKHALFSSLGPEPLAEAFTTKCLATSLAGKKTPIKSALLDQRVVAGLGNIYVCEALYRAGISPKRLALRVAGGSVARLVRAIQLVLREAIKAGGSSLRDYAHADGELGYFQHHFDVYDREDEACRRKGCGGTIKRIVQSGRSTFYCPKCQR